MANNIPSSHLIAMPRVLMLDKGSAYSGASINNLLDALIKHSPGAVRIKGAAEKAALKLEDQS